MKKALSNFRLASSHHLPGANQGSQGATKAYPGIQRIQQAFQHTKKQQLPQFSEDKPDSMPSSAQERMDLVAQAAQKIVATKLAICLHVANHRLDRVSAVSTSCSSAASGHAYCRGLAPAALSACGHNSPRSTKARLIACPVMRSRFTCAVALAAVFGAQLRAGDMVWMIELFGGRDSLGTDETLTGRAFFITGDLYNPAIVVNVDQPLAHALTTAAGTSDNTFSTGHAHLLCVGAWRTVLYLLVTNEF